jgi:uncharacterized protein
MKYKKCISAHIMFLSALIFLTACATAQNFQKVSGGQVIDMGRYSVTAPAGEGWQMIADRGNGTVQFQRLKTNFFGGVKRGTLINVYQEMLGPELRNKSEEDAANSIIDLEVKNMKEGGVRTGYALLDVKKDFIALDGKSLYTFTYRVKSLEKPVDLKAVLYIFFPPDFQDRYIVYRFLINETYDRSEGASTDLAIITPVINSLKIDTSAIAYQRFINALMPKAAAAGDVKAVMEFMDKGADVNARDDKGFTALMLASSYGKIEVAKLLVGKGADVNAVNNLGSTALIGAVIFGHAEVASLLISKGADVNIKDKKGYSALSIAKIQGYPEIVSLLQKAGARE